MATAAEIQAQIDACEASIVQADAEKLQADQEVALAQERQRLRRVLDTVQERLRQKKRAGANLRILRREIDSDVGGYYLPIEGSGFSRKPGADQTSGSICHTLDSASSILTGELEWRLKGLSWLKSALLLENPDGDEMDHAASSRLYVGHHIFRLLYHPDKGEMGAHNQRASLAIEHENDDEDGLAFRYKLLVMSGDRGYTQWGDDGHASTKERVDQFLFGPDVCDLNSIPSGIFGLTHEQLCRSEWVVNDELTVKLHVTVRPQDPASEELEDSNHSIALVPPSSLSSDLLALLDSGSNSDVTFAVRGDIVHAHLSVLCARSVVLQTLFNSGLQESTCKRVTIEDCEPVIFKGFLRYLYSDDFLVLEAFLHEAKKNGGPKGVESTAAESIMPDVEQLLALAHKYQISRLQAWCETKLSGGLSIGNVCGVLCQAHLYTATTLEKKCLEFIKQNMREVLETEGFSTLNQNWPQVNVKITATLVNAPQEKIAKVVELQQKTWKRKRDD